MKRDSIVEKIPDSLTVSDNNYRVRKNMLMAEADIPKSSSYFVMVGLVQGALLAATALWQQGSVFDPGLTAGITLFVLVLSNGGFHLDGLADTFDALAAKGDREKKLSVMKDGTIGPVGVIAIFFSLLIKYLAIKNLTIFPLFTSLFLTLVHACNFKIGHGHFNVLWKISQGRRPWKAFHTRTSDSGDSGFRHNPPFAIVVCPGLFQPLYVGQSIYILCDGPVCRSISSA